MRQTVPSHCTPFSDLDAGGTRHQFNSSFQKSSRPEHIDPPGRECDHINFDIPVRPCASGCLQLALRLRGAGAFVAAGTVCGRDAAVEPTGTYSRRVPADI